MQIVPDCVDENSYEEEMRLYLNTEDLDNSSKKKSNIQQYCSKKNTSMTENSKRSRIRRSDQLPQFEAFVEESDEDLPQVIFPTDENLSDGANEEINLQKKDDGQKGGNFSSVLINEDMEEAQVKNRIRRRSEVKGRRKSSLVGQISRVSNVRKRKTLSGANSSILPMIADTDDCDDFAGVNNSEKVDADSKRKGISNSANQPLQTILKTYSKVMNGITMSNNSVHQTVPEVIHVDDDLEVQGSPGRDEGNIRKNSDSCKESNHYHSEDMPGSPLSSDSEAFYIPEAPSEKDLKELIQFLGDMPIFPVDLLPVIQDWEKEYLTSKTSSVEQSNVNSGHDTISKFKRFDTFECDGDSNRINRMTDSQMKTTNTSNISRKETEKEKEHSMDGNSVQDDTLQTEVNLEKDTTPDNVVSEMEVEQVHNTDDKIDKNGEIESKVNVSSTNDNGEEITKSSKQEELNFSDSDSFPDSQPNFDLSFFDVLEAQPSNGEREEQQTSDVIKDNISTKQDKFYNETNIPVKKPTNSTEKPLDLNSYFDESFVECDPPETVQPLQCHLNHPVQDISKVKDSSSTVISSNKTPISLEKCVGRERSPKEDEFTFTQAMAIVHDSEEIVHPPGIDLDASSVEPRKDQAGTSIQNNKQGDSPNRLAEISTDNISCGAEDHALGAKFTKLQTKPVNARPSFSSSEEEEDVSALVQFDLGFDLDDVIPPSPCVSQNLSQITFSRCQSQSILKSRKSLATTYQEQCSQLSDSSHKDQPTGVREDAVLVHGELGRIQEALEPHSPPQNNSPDNVIEELDPPPSPILSGKKSISHKLSRVKEDFHESQKNKRMSPETSFPEKNKKLSPETSFPEIVERSVLDSFSSDDEVVRVKRRKKPVIFDSPATPLTQKHVDDEDFDTPAKPVATVQSVTRIVTDDDFITPVKPSLKKSFNFDSSNEKPSEKKVKNSKHCVSFALPPDFSDEDDFDVDITALKKSVMKKGKNRKSKSSVKEPNNKIKARKSKSPLVAEFLEEEAEVSDEEDGYCGGEEEEEGSDLDCYENSFIGDATQLSQRTSENMHAIYLKSVKSPPVRGRFKLSDCHYNMDVFSQPPPAEESQYLEDSFVVDEDDEEDEEDSVIHTSPDEVTMMDLSDISCVGRRTRWSKPGKRSVPVKPKITDGGSKRRRIRVMEDSSSSEGENVHNLSSETLHVGIEKRKPNRVLLSSSSEEEETSSKRQEDSAEHLTKLKSSDKQCNDLFGNQSYNANVGSLSSTTMKISPLSSANAVFDQRKSTEEQQRLERLQKQKEKQEEFRRRMAAKKGVEVAENKHDTEKVGRRSIVSSTGLIMNSSSSSATDTNEKHVILVDSREINGCQDIISELRFKHGIAVQTAQLSHCDYIVSNRMGVDRQQWSEFTNGSRKDKLVERVTALCELFDKPALIIEKDSVKADDKNSSTKPLHWTKYVEKTLVHLLRSKVTLFFTDHQKDTARVLSEICRLEARKKAGIVAPTDLYGDSQAELRFYTSIPGLSYINALNLCHNYKSIRGFIVSEMTQIMTKGCLSKERASRIKDYLQRKFDPQMLPSNR